MTAPKKKQSKRVGLSIKKESVNASDYLRFNLKHACEHCSHFNLDTSSCSLGLNSIPHHYENQMQDFLISGKLAFCRFIEID